MIGRHGEDIPHILPVATPLAIFNRLQKERGSQFVCMMFFFVCLLRDYAANYESILLDRVDLRGGPILILLKSI